MKQTLTKPCARANRGCLGQIEESWPSDLRDREYCSRACSARARIEAGWQPHRHLTQESRQRGGTIGGSISGVKHRAKAMRMWLKRTHTKIPASMRDALGSKDLRLLKVLLARATRRAWKLGYDAHAQHVRPKGRKAA